MSKNTSFREDQLDVMVVKGHDGTVHVRTERNLEDEMIDQSFQEITDRIGETAINYLDLSEPQGRSKSIDKFHVKSRHGAEKPTKLHK